MDTGNIYKTLIVDDEPHAREQLADMLKDRGDIEIIKQCKNGLEAINAINSEHPDFVFLDVEMPEINGFEVIENIESEHFPLIVFVTAFSKYAVKAFEVNALDYIHKPFNKARLEKTLKKIKARKEQGGEQLQKEQMGKILRSLEKPETLDRFIIKYSGEYDLVRSGEIMWIESDGNYSRVITAKKKYMVRYTISGFEEQLDSKKFYRISRSKIVNVDYVRKIKNHIYGNYLVELNNSVDLKMSKNFRRLLDSLKNF